MKRLVIAILGNVNNYPLLLAEGLIQHGHHVRLLINRKELLHRPEAKYPDWLDKYPPWVTDISDITDLDVAYETSAIDAVVNHLTNNIDLAILNDIGPYFAKYLKCPHVAFLTGSDLTYYANYDSVDLRTRSWDIEFRSSFTGRRITRKLSELVMNQRDGILSAKLTTFCLRGLSANGDKILDSIGIPDSQRMMIYLSNVLKLTKQPAAGNNQLRILNGSRISWQQNTGNSNVDMDLKGTDILLKGFAIFCQNGGVGELRLFNKGADVSIAKDMCVSLKIDRSVVWLNEMSLNDFILEMISADLVCDQLSKSFPGMVTADAFALGRPVLANFRNEIYANQFPEPLPGLQASTPDEVCEKLLQAQNDRAGLIALGENSREFAEKYLNPVTMAEILLNKCGF